MCFANFDHHLEERWLNIACDFNLAKVVTSSQLLALVESQSVDTKQAHHTQSEAQTWLMLREHKGSLNWFQHVVPHYEPSGSRHLS